MQRLTPKEKMEKIHNNPNFSLCGVKVSQMVYDESNGLFFIAQGKCRVSANHIISAMSSTIYKQSLEKEINFRSD